MRGILFDKDGTLLDFHASWSRVYRELCLDLAGGNPDGGRALLIAGGMDPDSGAVRAGSLFAAANTVEMVAGLFPQLTGEERRAMVARVDRAFYANGVRFSVLLPGVKETLADLAATGMALGVATSDGTAGTRAALAALAIDGYLPHVFGYDSVPSPKPAGDMVLAFCAAAGVRPAEVVVVGDNTHDLEMARAAGAGAAVGVLSGTGERIDLAPLADAVLDSVCDLPGWLGGT